jgi:hypothetical protein
MQRIDKGLTSLLIIRLTECLNCQKSLFGGNAVQRRDRLVDHAKARALSSLRSNRELIFSLFVLQNRQKLIPWSS